MNDTLLALGIMLGGGVVAYMIVAFAAYMTVRRAQKERITQVAIRYEGAVYSLPSPNRHHHILLRLAQRNLDRWPISGQQGFVTSTGRFVNRNEAFMIAEKAGQLIRRHKEGELFSEDLW